MLGHTLFSDEVKFSVFFFFLNKITFALGILFIFLTDDGIIKMNLRNVYTIVWIILNFQKVLELTRKYKGQQTEGTDKVPKKSLKG